VASVTNLSPELIAGLASVLAIVVLVMLVREHLHVLYRATGARGVKRRAGITRARRFVTRMREYRSGKDRGSRSWEWNREIWCWLPVPYRLLRMVGHSGWLRRCVTVQLVWGRARVLEREEAEIRRWLPTHNVQHTGRRRLEPQPRRRFWKVAA
jgi:hypothetical protein